jgi:hypothetical protein
MDKESDRKLELIAQAAVAVHVAAVENDDRGQPSQGSSEG